VTHITNKRRLAIKSRLREKGFDAEQIYKKIPESKFLLGENDRGWRCDFDFVWGSPHNWVKILEGKYIDHRWDWAVKPNGGNNG
jgi:hypothetical protein